jgi:hypothetical protein
MLVLTMMLASMPVMAQEPEQEAQNVEEQASPEAETEPAPESEPVVEEQTAEDSGVEAAAATTDYNVGNTNVQVSYGWRTPYVYATASVNSIGTSLLGYNIILSLPTSPARLKSNWHVYVPSMSNGQRVDGNYDVNFRCDSAYMHSKSGTYNSYALNYNYVGKIDATGSGYYTPSIGDHSLSASAWISGRSWRYDSGQQNWQMGDMTQTSASDSSFILVI